MNKGISLKNFNNTNENELNVVHILIARKINSSLNKTLKEYGMSPVEWLVLSIIAGEEKDSGVRVTDLANLLDVKTTYVTAALRQLQNKEFVKTKKHANDARAKLITTTKNGDEALATIKNDIHSKIKVLFSDDAAMNDGFEYYIKFLNKIVH